MKHLLMLGGGHANALAMLRVTGLTRLTLVSKSTHAPYSGMVPGYIAGRYTADECFIDLRRLADKCQAELIIGQAQSIADDNIILADGRQVAFDVLSVNTGAEQKAPFVAADGMTIKPIPNFIHWAQHLDEDATTTIAVIGGGAGGVETALALAYRRRQAPPPVLICRSFLPEFPTHMQRRLRQLLDTRGIRVYLANAIAHQNNAVVLADGNNVPANKVVFAVSVSAPDWLKTCDLAKDKNGFLSVNKYLQSVTASNIFITGDAAAHHPPVAKAGVMATRQSRVLAHNLRVMVSGAGALKPWPIRRRALAIIGAGNNFAIAGFGELSAAGKWVWRWKHWLDTRFMCKFK